MWLKKYIAINQNGLPLPHYKIPSCIYSITCSLIANENEEDCYWGSPNTCSRSPYKQARSNLHVKLSPQLRKGNLHVFWLCNSFNIYVIILWVWEALNIFLDVPSWGQIRLWWILVSKCLGWDQVTNAQVSPWIKGNWGMTNQRWKNPNAQQIFVLVSPNTLSGLVYVVKKNSFLSTPVPHALWTRLLWWKPSKKGSHHSTTEEPQVTVCKFCRKTLLKRCQKYAYFMRAYLVWLI